MRKTGERKRGVPKQTLPISWEEILPAAARVGGLKGRDALRSFLRRLAKKDPKGFGTLLRDLLHSQLEGRGVDNKTNVIHVTTHELRAEFERLGVPIPKEFESFAQFETGRRSQCWECYL